jgi:hypothetical protein
VLPIDVPLFSSQPFFSACVDGFIWLLNFGVTSPIFQNNIV